MLGNTCPDIDKNIYKFKNEVYALVGTIIDDISPLYFHTSVCKKYIEIQCSQFYDNVEYLFEDVRSTNSNLRKSAESDINHLNDQIDDYRNTIDDLESEINSLKDQINSMKY